MNSIEPINRRNFIKAAATAGAFVVGCFWAIAFAICVRSAAAENAKIPTRLPNGERPWSEIPADKVEKIRAALPEKAPAPPRKPRRLLVFCRADNYPHYSIPDWNKMLELLGQKTGAFVPTFSQVWTDLMPDRLREFDAVFLNNTTRMSSTPEAVKNALQEFVKGGKGLAGNHGSGDNWHDWPEGLEMMGGEFVTHPFGSIVIKVDDPKSPLMEAFEGKSFPFQDEIYAFKAPYSREKLHLLLSIDYPNSPRVAKTEQTMKERAAAPNARKFDIDTVVAARDDHDYGIAWVHRWGKGRVFYCSLGHVSEVTWNPAIVRFNLAGIQYVLGDLDADDSPSVPAR